MAFFPVCLPQKNYTSTTPIASQWKITDWNRKVDKLEAALNEMVAAQLERARAYLYLEVARETGLSIEFIQKVFFSLYAGSGGFTGIKRE